MWIALAGSLLTLNTKTAAQGTRVFSLQEFTATPQYQANITRLFASLPSDVFQRCPTLVSTGSRVTILEPAVFAADGRPIAGAWKQSYPVSGCGNDTTINLYFKAQPDMKILSTVGAPGETHAGLVLQRDTVRYAFFAASVKRKDCSSMHLRSTKFDGAPTANGSEKPVGASALSAPWQEIWSVSACGTVYDIPITFIPDATGTTIRAGSAGVATR
jgi:hypothetical protein